MPGHEEHCKHSEQRYGVRGDDIHTWMDEPSYLLGGYHRDERHDPRRDLPIILSMFGEEYGNDVARHIFLDHIYLDRQESARNRKQNMSKSIRANEYSEPIPNRISQPPQYNRPLTRRDVYLFMGILGAILTIFSSIGFFPWNLIDNILGGIIGILITIVAIIIYSIDKRSHR